MSQYLYLKTAVIHSIKNTLFFEYLQRLTQKKNPA
jgi:hypothetical protein